MYLEQCIIPSSLKDNLGLADSSACRDVSFASPFGLELMMHNCSQNPVAASIMEANPGPAELLWTNATDVFHNVAVLDWTLFFLSLVVPRKFPIKFNKSIFAKYGKVLRLLDDGVKQLLKVLFGLFLLLGSVFIFSPIILALAITSEVVKMILRFKYGRGVTKADPFDAVWGNESKDCRPYISVAVTLRGTPAVEKIRKVIQEKILDLKNRDGSPTYKKFYQVLQVEYGYFVWKDAIDFDLKNHVRVWKDPLNTKDRQQNETSSELSNDITNITSHEDSRTTGTEALICRYMNDYGATGMSEDKPKWEIVILESEQSPAGRYAVVMRLHHAIGDGISLVKLVMGAMADNPVAPPAWPKPKINPLLRVLMLLWSFCFMPLELGAALKGKETNPLHGGAMTGKKTFHLSRGIKLDTMKKIKSASKTTINDVLMTCLSAAFSKTFGERCGQKMTLMMPICYHDPVEEPLVNKILMAPLFLPTPAPSSDITPPSRLHMVKEQCDAMKSTPGLVAGRHTMGFMSALLPASVARAVLTLPALTMGASNVPGPQHEMLLWGDTLESVAFWVPDRDPTGAGVGIISYRGMFRLGLSCDMGMGATPQELQQVVTEFEREVERLSACFSGPKKKD